MYTPFLLSHRNDPIARPECRGEMQMAQLGEAVAHGIVDGPFTDLSTLDVPSITVFDMLNSEGVESIMRPLILVVSCLTLARVCAYGQAADVPSFEVASVKPASPSATAISCSGGPGTASPGIWRCSNVPLAF